MKNLNFRILMSAICLVSILAAFAKVDAGPIRFDQVVQVVNAKPGRAETINFARLTLAGNYDDLLVGGDDDDDKKKKQDGRVITETKSDIVVEEDCNCEQEPPAGPGFPKWALLGLAAIPIAFILIKRKKDEPTPTPTIPGQTPTPTVTPTPTITPTPTPTTPTPTPKTPTPTPPVTPTPTPPQPVPEPVTILLFGTGLASIGLAARRKFGKKSENGDGTGPDGDDNE